MPGNAVRDVVIAASDGFELAGVLYEPAVASRNAVVVIGAATGVPQWYYARFARFLAEQGAAVLTFDYRGIGKSRPDSLRGFKARMREWGELDCAGVLTWADGYAAGRSIRWIGHSYGGFGPAFAPNGHLIDRLLAVATMSGYWHNIRGRERVRVGVIMWGVMPILARVVGYFPGHLGGGEDLPHGVALEFSRWCRSPGFFFDDATMKTCVARLDRFAAPARFCRATDDPWCTPAAQGDMSNRFVGAAARSEWIVDPGPAGGPIGHVGFFRDRFRETLWPDAAQWILDGA
jgi:predicted alpha/beta hydrolase